MFVFFVKHMNRSGYVTQNYFPGLAVPVLTCLSGGISSVCLYRSSEFSVAIGFLYLTWLLGEGWFVGVVTSIQQVFTRI